MGVPVDRRALLPTRGRQAERGSGNWEAQFDQRFGSTKLPNRPPVGPRPDQPEKQSIINQAGQTISRAVHAVTNTQPIMGALTGWNNSLQLQAQANRTPGPQPGVIRPARTPQPPPPGVSSYNTPKSSGQRPVNVITEMGYNSEGVYGTIYTSVDERWGGKTVSHWFVPATHQPEPQGSDYGYSSYSNGGPSGGGWVDDYPLLSWKI